MLVKIEAALRRLSMGTYGDCSVCGLPIAESRLYALPFALRCRDCEQAREAASVDSREFELRRVQLSYRLFD